MLKLAVVLRAGFRRVDVLRSVSIWFIVVVLCASAGVLRAQDRRIVTGVVVDVGDRPVPSARIQNGKQTVTTDDSGRFRVVVPNRDRALLEVSRIGFMPSRFGVAEGGDTSVSVLLLPAVQQLEKVNVTSTATDNALEGSGFAQRLRDREHGSNSGIFITAAEIDRRHPSRITAIFEDLPGVTVCRRSTIETCGLVGNHLIPNQAGTGYVKCPITVYLDGHRLDPPHNPNDRTRALDIDADVIPADVAGLEYYPSGNRIPDRFQLLNGSCGLVLIWTKRG